MIEATPIPLSAPKVVAAIVDNRVHVAIGFSSDSHDQIADSVFRTSIGDDWRTRANNYGGGKLLIDFSGGKHKIVERSTSLENRPVPFAAERVITQWVQAYLEHGTQQQS